MENTSEIVLNPEALAFNLDFLRQEMGPDVEISSVVKGNAYGHGIEAFVPLAEKLGIRHFSVFSTGEAARVSSVLREKTSEMMIMGDIAPGQLEWVIRSGFSFFVFDMGRLKEAISLAAVLNIPAKIHLELETGMNRTGFNQQTVIKEVIPFLMANKMHYVFSGLCTHFAGAESIANYLRIERQQKRFVKTRKLFLQAGLTPERTHTCCSAAAIRLVKMRFDLVRIGILQYGFWPSPEIKIEYLRSNKLPNFNLHRVITWKSRLMAIKKVSMGEFIGYGNSYQASEDMQVGIVPVGYSNGYSRTLSNSGRVLIRGVRTTVLGNVNMNSFVISLQQVQDAQVGDEVVLIGAADDLEISVASFGELSNQLNYELLTRLPMDIPRIYLNQ
ncbi:alanine racemase [Arachidicoccus terrestris]|uniref:alanine racemase n=1 Tax=Arachidicoccus terrestris TaxID=2875539 RepID=UPI001CC58DC4|nr:alanine racemase [Arachidicoccus terrestris]UAY56667.1 alanine racemase [Arachidicoccus terrestris]